MAPHSATTLATLAALGLLLALPAQGGSPDAPEVPDGSGDAGLPPLDIASAWFEADGTRLTVHIERAEGSDTVPPAVACQAGQCAGASVSLRVVYEVLGADGKPVPTLDGYAASYVLVRLGASDPNFTAVAGYYDGAGNPTVVEPVTVTVDGPSIDVVVPLASETIGMRDGPLAGSRLGAPYALSYVMTCAPEEGCLSHGAPDPQVASLWDRAPDSGTGADYWLPSQDEGPAPPPAASSSTTVTVVETQTATVTRTETFERTATVTVTPNAEMSKSKASPTAGLLVAFAVVGLAALRRRLD
jgi:hypothetical protein